MNRYHIPYYLLLLLLSIFPGLKAQNLLPDAAGERIEACTDRTLYISGEQILFSVEVSHPDDSISNELSRIFYCELISPDGNRIAGGKYLLQNSKGAGSITIPEETISGIYFLKFYTRFMRNISTGEYKYILLKIVNPFKTEVLQGNEVLDSAAWCKNNLTTTQEHFSLTLLSGEKSFSPRGEIRLILREEPGFKSSSVIAISIIPEFTYQGSFLPDDSKPTTTTNGFYYPETRGISLTGQLIGKETGMPLPGTKVYLSIIGDKDILVDRTNANGKFFFVLPDYAGYKDLFLCTEDLPDVTPELLIDNDFCSRPVSLPSLLFSLNQDEMKAAYQLAVNSRITSLFSENRITGDSTEMEEITSFYGKPTEVLVMEKYIDLPTLEEYFTELTANVKIKREQGRKRFRFLTTLEDMRKYDPLVLVDWVAVDDMDKILSMSPLNIDRIELVNAPYVKGDVTYGGIISFVSKNNDFAGIDLPTSGTFFNYPFLNDVIPAIAIDSIQGTIPDSRNTIYWNPSIQPDDDGTARISFTAPDTPGNYVIILRRLSPSGEVVLKEERFVVEGN
jgi:hypothetical protein